MGREDLMVSEIINRAILRSLARAIASIPDDLSEIIFWEAYKEWFNHNTGPLVGHWNALDCPTDLHSLAEALGMEWSDFIKANIGELAYLCHANFSFDEKLAA